MSYKRSRANYEADKTPAQAPFVFYGTPLPPLDSEARDDGSYVPLWKQEVRDERGRKRLHGAFTGGFSAGYYNTVGSKEGWTPSAFVSSRSNKLKDETTTTQQRAEDFMDEEDLANAAEAQKLETQGSFAGLGSTEEDGMRQGFLTDLFKTSGDTMGVKLLQRMGWRQGQGVGPKVKRKARSEDASTTQIDQELHLFAPDESRMVSFHKKTDRFGLGHAGEEGLGSGFGRGGAKSAKDGDHEQDEDDADDVFNLNKSKKTKSKPKKSGFGVGILNDTGSDDEDAYSMGPKISYNRVIGGDKKKKKGGLVANTAAATATKPIFQSRKLAQRTNISSGFRRCHDGRLPLDGFVLALALLSNDQENKYPPPVVPEGWTPSKLSSEPSKSATFQSTADAARSSSLNPAQRAALLGESSLPGKSIFDYLSAAARDRLAASTNRPDLPTGKGESAPAGYEPSASDRTKSLWDFVPRLDTSIAAAALRRGTSGWMPYAEDEAKRARYRRYLECMASSHQDLPDRVKGSSIDEWGTEMREFAQAAQVFKPISGLMASRFTTSSSVPKLASDAPEGSSSEQRSAAGGLSQAQPAKEKEKDPAEQAAAIGMFGPMTRSRDDFYPTRLLCKRFNVKPPAHVLADPGGADGQGAKSAAADSRLDVVSKTAMEQMMREASWNSGGVKASGAVPTAAGESSEIPMAPLPKAEAVNVEKNDALEGQRAGEEVFKAIFGSDDEDD